MKAIATGGVGDLATGRNDLTTGRNTNKHALHEKRSAIQILQPASRRSCPKRSADEAAGKQSVT